MLPRPRRAGFTLVELIIVVAIIGVVAGVGWGYVGDLLPRNRCRKAATEFAATVDHLRAQAVTDNREYAIYLAAYDAAITDPSAPNEGAYWLLAGNASLHSTAWEFMPCDAEDGADDDVSEGVVDISEAGDETLADVSIAQWSSIAGPSHGGLLNTDTIVFSPRGWVTNPNGDFSDNGHITVRFVNKKALLRGASEFYEVRIARSGFTRVDYNRGLYTSVDSNTIGLDGSTRDANEASSP